MTIQPGSTANTPQAGYTVTTRVIGPNGPLLLPRLAATVSRQQGVVTGVDLVDVTTRGATVDLTFLASDEAHVSRVVAAIETNEDVKVRRISDPTFLYHIGGKIEIRPRSRIRTRQDLIKAYTPGVGRISTDIANNPDSVWSLTAKGTSVAIVTNGTAVLGLGNIGPAAALPVMEGKSMLFKEFGHLNAYPICLDAPTAEEVIAATKAIAPGFGGINLEDIAAPDCFIVEERLQAELDIPVFHDDQHGTAVVVAAGLINAARITDREFAHMRVVHVGAGAAGTAICRALLDAGVKDLTVVDREGVLTDDERTPEHHRALAALTNPQGFKTIEEALAGADAVVSTSIRGSYDPALVHTMAPQPIIFALANPMPEVLPEEAPEDAVVATGRSDMPNQINNSLCFPGFFRGALEARATTVTLSMKQAAMHAIADSVSQEQRGLGIVIPTMFQAGLHDNIAKAVKQAWLDHVQQAEEVFDQWQER